MRHKVKNKKFGRSTSHRKATMAALVRGLIEQKQIKTTLAKAKQARILAEKMVTLGRKGTLAARRNVVSVLADKKLVAKLFSEIVPQFDGRNGGYTRVTKLGQRIGDGAQLAILEWVGITAVSKKKKKTKDTKKEAAA